MGPGSYCSRRLSPSLPGRGFARVPAWARRPGLAHGFLGRGYPPPWREALARLGLRGVPLIRPRQVHGASVIVVPRGEATVVTGEADGLICEGGGRLLGVVTADCVPVLVVAPGRRVAGVLHAGWRGMAAGIVSVGLARLRSDLGVRPGEIEVALGPSIDRCCYEVGAVVREALVRGCGEARGVWQRVGSNWRLDLRDLVRVLLEQGGVPARAIHRVGPCTGCAVDRYYSYRREGRGAGRQLSFVGWLSNGLPAAEVMGR